MSAPLRPQPKMRPNDRCWCNSGLKWKKCHENREAARPVHFGEAYSKSREEAAASYCSHPDAPIGCGKRIIKAHAVQRGGGLAAIAEGGLVMSVTAGVGDFSRNDGELVPKS